jgi:hypothetical protein
MEHGVEEAHIAMMSEFPGRQRVSLETPECDWR